VSIGLRRVDRLDGFARSSIDRRFVFVLGLRGGIAAHSFGQPLDLGGDLGAGIALALVQPDFPANGLAASKYWPAAA
jgi:hypothetical protein